MNLQVCYTFHAKEEKAGLFRYAYSFAVPVF